MDKFNYTCQVWVRDYTYASDGNTKELGAPHRCGANLILEVSGYEDLTSLVEYEMSIPSSVEDVPVECWEVKCQSGHVIAIGFDEGGDPTPFSIEALVGYVFPDPMIAKFALLTREWRDDTRLDSSTLNIVTHPAYEQIIAMGEGVLPLIFAEMAKTPDTPNHWFGALREITGRDVAKGEDTIDGAAEKWLAWWRRVKYI